MLFAKRKVFNVCVRVQGRPRNRDAPEQVGESGLREQPGRPDLRNAGRAGRELGLREWAPVRGRLVQACASEHGCLLSHISRV